ncbi:MAG: ABC-ATPase domain-containing protein, partial [Nitrospinales bacterium]
MPRGSFGATKNMDIRIPEELRKIFPQIDGRGYKAYKVLQGKIFDYSPFRLKFEHVQGDPYAAPSRISVSIDLSATGFSGSLFDTPARKLAFEDYLLRTVHRQIKPLSALVRGSGKSGLISVMPPSQKILQRNALLVLGKTLQLVMFAGLPADGRRVSGKECLRMFAEVLPRLWADSLLASSLNLAELKRHIHTLEDYHALRGWLEKNNWVSFIANGSLTARASGISDQPLEEGGGYVVSARGGPA